jgi:hypothetical protein
MVEVDSSNRLKAIVNLVTSEGIYISLCASISNPYSIARFRAPKHTSDSKYWNPSRIPKSTDYRLAASVLISNSAVSSSVVAYTFGRPSNFLYLFS